MTFADVDMDTALHSGRAADSKQCPICGEELTYVPLPLMTSGPIENRGFDRLRLAAYLADFGVVCETPGGRMRIRTDEGSSLSGTQAGDTVTFDWEENG